jgi:hypothetical protein
MALPEALDHAGQNLLRAVDQGAQLGCPTLDPDGRDQTLNAHDRRGVAGSLLVARRGRG